MTLYRPLNWSLIEPKSTSNLPLLAISRPIPDRLLADECMKSCMKIQRVFRGKRGRREYETMRLTMAAVKIQAHFRGRKARVGDLSAGGLASIGGLFLRKKSQNIRHTTFRKRGAFRCTCRCFCVDLSSTFRCLSCGFRVSSLIFAVRSCGFVLLSFCSFSCAVRGCFRVFVLLMFARVFWTATSRRRGSIGSNEKLAVRGMLMTDHFIPADRTDSGQYICHPNPSVYPCFWLHL